MKHSPQGITTPAKCTAAVRGIEVPYPHAPSDSADRQPTLSYIAGDNALTRPVFFDPSGRRRRWTGRGVLVAILLALLASAVFATTVVAVPSPSPLPLGFERTTPLPFRSQVVRIKRKIVRFLHGTPNARDKLASNKPLTIAFYTSWTDESAPALARHIDQIDWVAPTLLSLTPSGQLTSVDDPPLRRIVGSSMRRPLVLPVVQNAINGRWDGEAVATLMRDPARRQKLIADLAAYLDKNRDAGVIFDFENLPATSLDDLARLVAQTRAAFAPRHKIVAVTMPIDNPAWPARALANASDKLILMAYDEHWQGGQPGPIASNAWFTDRLGSVMRAIPRGKAVVALGNYGYDWHDGHADSLTVEEGWLAAHDSGAMPQYDKSSGNLGFSYLDNNSRHDVWMLDAAASWNEMHVLSGMGIKSIALWRLGSEDPDFWSALSAWRTNAPPPQLGKISEERNVDIEGNGEILRITAQPHSGQRRLEFDPRSKLVMAETYLSLPTPFVVHRTGARRRLVSLTFDDGPDPVWTPKILSVLERYHVPGTFFIIGENGVSNASLLKRMIADGDEIGNHSYTHPNMADEGTAGVALELNATQRLIQAYTGRSTRLFRAPYFGDAEPTTADELTPALLAQERGYTVVGLHVDPADWRTPGTASIIQRTLDQVEHPDPDRSGNIILLHDGGGNRAQTVAALPAIISGLERAGYRFVPASTLAGLDRDAVMPRVDGVDLLAVRADIAAFSVIAVIITALKWTFFFAISLGVMRAVALTILAAWPRRVQVPDDPSYDPTVTVIVPAFNEERVIVASVRRLLESDYPNIEVIVADDGSKDATSPVVAEAFAGEPKVKLLTLVNGGKASAINRALTHASGEIVVAVDADTLFETTCIGRLVRWFADERIGAVAGNAKVGNRVNLVTRWQAVEYVTAQNVERRALSRFDAIMVVPGAVGAWRRAALDEVGGYPEDTLAEDQDLTIAIQRRGWKVAYDEHAVAWTEAPESFRALAKQRYRWSYGTLQCLWKHRGLLKDGRPSGLAFIGMPQAWVFQIAFALVSPAIDLALLMSILGTAVRVAQHGWAQTHTDVLRMAMYWLVFTGIDLFSGWVAYRLDVRERRMPPLLLIGQRFVYRQVMYGVVIRAVSSALSGLGVGWGKLERTGRASAPAGSGERQPDRSHEPVAA